MTAVRPVTLSTHGHPPGEQHELWEQVLSAALYPVRVQHVGAAPRPLDARFTAAATTSTRLTQGALSPVRTVITPAAASAAPSDQLELTVSRTSARHVETASGRTTIPPHHLIAQLGDVACTHENAERDHSVLLSVPIAALSLDPAALRSILLRPLALPRAAEAVLDAAAALVLAPGGGLTVDAADKYLLGVAELVVRSVLHASTDHAETAPARRQQALDHIVAELHSPGLTPDSVAVALHMSRRRLYQLFADTPGVAATIRELRVARAAALLVDPACTGWSVERVAHACGFTSPSTFSRAFAATTGHSPSEHRAG